MTIYTKGQSYGCPFKSIVKTYSEFVGGNCMNSVIIYGSHYGTTKRYAEKFSEMTKGNTE